MLLADILMATLPSNYRAKKKRDIKVKAGFVSQAAALVGLMRHTVTTLSAGIFCVGLHHYS